jgi:aspartate dehydrogenase
MLTIGPRPSEPLRVGLWGCGELGTQVAAGIRAGLAGNVRVLGVLARRRSPALLETAASLAAEPCTDLDAFLRLRPTIVLEVARAAGLAELGPRILEAGVDLVALSPSCLFDEAVEARFQQAAQASGRTLLIPSASADGVDLLLANRRDELRSVRLSITWPPNAELPPYTGNGEPQEVFAGTAREVGRLYPRQLNFVVTIALAGLGLDRTEVRMRLDPTARSTGYVLEVDAAATSLRAEVQLRRPTNQRGRTAVLAALETLRELAGER